MVEDESRSGVVVDLLLSADKHSAIKEFNGLEFVTNNQKERAKG